MMRSYFVGVLLLALLSLTSCEEAKTPSLSKIQKDLPRVEFIECNGSISETSLERKTYINKREVEKDGVTTVSFDFVRDCCLEFVGKWELEDEVLTLSYHPKDEVQEPCDCKCMYTMKYHFKSEAYSWYRVKIRSGK